MFFLLLLILPGVRTQEATPSSIPSYHHPFNSVQFVQHKTSKKGPILFPNDAPPPPPTPLIVTSRPLSESIARSELNPNNSQAAQSQYYQVSFKPEYLARGKDYKPYSYTLATVTPVYDFESAIHDTARPVQGHQRANFYKDYQKRLMESIYRRTENTIRHLNAWDRPIQRRRIDQIFDPALRARKTNFDNDSKGIMVGSINSREASYYNNDDRNVDTENDNDNDFDQDKVVSGRRQDLDPFQERTGRITTPYHIPETSIYNYGKRNMKRRLNSRETNRYIQARPLRSINTFNANDNINNKYVNMRHQDTEEDLSDSNEKLDGIRHVPTRTTTNKNTKKPSRLRSYSLRTLRMRPVHSIEKKPQDREARPLYELDDNVQKDLNIPPKSDRFKYQEKYPEEYNYYKTNDAGHDTSKEYNHGENYAFSYTVKDQKTGDDFSHSQKSTGSATNGEYRVRLPDGRMQVVSYTADENGYKADVRYDEHHTQDNSIDIDVSKENRYRNDNLPTTYKLNVVTNNANLDNQDSFDNDEYLRPRFNSDKTLQNQLVSKFSTKTYRPVTDIFINPTNNYDNKNDFDYLNDFGQKTGYQNNNGYQSYNNNYQTKSAFVDTTKVNVDDGTTDRLTDNNNDYLEHYNDKLVESNDKVQRTKDEEYFKFSDEIPFSKEIMDYSSELSQGYQPHRSKFSTFNNNNDNTKPTVVPSYDDLKEIFVTNGNRRQNAAIPVIVPTVRPNFDVTPENVVAITPKKPNLYTNIKNIVSVTPNPYVYSTPSPSTPSSYLYSTIANLKHQINLANKPVLSHQYINKINKYLTYK